MTAKPQPLIFNRDRQTDALTVAEWLPMTIMATDLLVGYDEIEAVVAFTTADGTRRYRVANVSADDRELLLELIPE